LLQRLEQSFSAARYAYLVNLWEREPENGLVNLELARIAVQRADTERALRYYHNAIYAIWPGDQEVQRRDARLEPIEYLLRINVKTQAQAGQREEGILRVEDAMRPATGPVDADENWSAKHWSVHFSPWMRNHPTCCWFA
jgi:hypothetical protein